MFKNQMKSTRCRIVPLFLAVLWLLSGCQPYEEGPAISFRSKDRRMNILRPIKFYTVDGIDSLNAAEERMIEATDSSYEKGMVLSWGASDPDGGNICGELASPYPCFAGWSYGSDEKQDISLYFPGFVSNSEWVTGWEIVKLRENEVIFERSFNQMVFRLGL